MIISVEKIKQLVTFEGWSDEKIEMKLKAIEQTIRAYTNNNFQKRGIRSRCSVLVGGLYGDTTGFAVDDTVQVSESAKNGGLYVITAVDDGGISVAGELLEESSVLVTKVEYPADVVACCVNLMEWEMMYRDKVGIKSETLSRHSVTYEDSGAMFNGYPVGILNSLNLHKKARF